MSKKERNNGSVSQPQIDIWKAKHGEVKEITIPLDDEGKEVAIGYFRKPDLNIIGASSKFVDTDPVKSGKILFDSCYLGGASDFQTNDEVKMSAILCLNRLFKIRLGDIKNL